MCQPQPREGPVGRERGSDGGGHGRRHQTSWERRSEIIGENALATWLIVEAKHELKAVLLGVWIPM